MILSLGALSTTIKPPAASASDVAGMLVFLDPGHNGLNDSSLTRQVPNGRGGTKQCNTSGTATNGGYPEHSFNWDVTLRVQDSLTQNGRPHRGCHGITTPQLVRASISALRWQTPCIPMRLSASTPMAGRLGGRGFHVNYSDPPLNEAQSGPAVRFAHR